MASKDLTPFKAFNFTTEDEEALFTAPTISEDTRLKMAADLGLQKRKEVTKPKTKAAGDAFNVDTAARAGLKLSSVLMLVAESLSRVHQQSSNDQDGLSRQETLRLTSLLAPMGKLMFEQFARISRASVQTRRSLVLDSFEWPSTSARAHLESLPFLGKDLFNDQFLKA
ncbi:hypothetical protein, partial [Salmonella sp. s55004]|uniref:hypothetical protein n=1 Tax=Salmonella sp. s55004 TaxID=3159675 RepID=UPI00397EF088